jgi:hypothetical protein
MSLILFSLIGVLLFALAFILRRRFGMLALALCAGIVLSNVLTDASADALQIFGIGVAGLSTTALASSLLILLPSFILMVGGPRYNGATMAVVGSVFYAVFALVLLVLPLQATLATDGASQQVVDTILSYQSLIIVVFVVLGLLDALAIKAPRFGKKH